MLQPLVVRPHVPQPLLQRHQRRLGQLRRLRGADRGVHLDLEGEGLDELGVRGIFGDARIFHRVILVIVKLDSQEEADTDHEDEGVELIYLRPHEFKLSISQPVYETSLLALPMIRNCDEMETKPCDEVMIQKLETLNSESTMDEVVDPRWEKLKQLKNL